MGSEANISPEAITRQEYSKATDAWALGVLLYEMRTGLSPFEGSTHEETIFKIKEGEPHYPPLSPELADLIRLLLKKEPTERLVDTEAIRAHPWFELVNWSALHTKANKAPFVPQLKDEFDIGCFDKAFTKETFSPQQSFEGEVL